MIGHSNKSVAKQGKSVTSWQWLMYIIVVT